MPEATERLKRQHDVDHFLHVWMNERQQERRKQDEPFEHDLYEWKYAMAERERLPHWLKLARTGTLPTDHQQCSLSPTEPLPENHLACALGQDVTQCPILISLYASFKAGGEEREQRRSEHYQPIAITADDADTAAATVCTWHIFTEQLKRDGHIDTSEGYMQDSGDRLYWKTVYEHLRADDPEAWQCPNCDGEGCRLCSDSGLTGLDGPQMAEWRDAT